MHFFKDGETAETRAEVIVCILMIPYNCQLKGLTTALVGENGEENLKGKKTTLSLHYLGMLCTM